MAQYAELHLNESSAFLGTDNYLSNDTIRGVVKRRRAIVNAVLLEQERQYRSDNIDADIMAVVSEAISGLSARRARLIARLHQSEFQNHILNGHYQNMPLFHLQYLPIFLTDCVSRYSHHLRLRFSIPISDTIADK